MIMRKPFAAILIGMLLVSSISAQKMRTDREKYELRGPVRSVRTEIVTEEEKRELSEFYAFDVQGRLVEEISAEEYLDQGPWKSVYTYDEQGFVSEKAEFEKDDLLSGKIIYAYDNKGNKTEEQYYGVEGRRYRQASYDTKGKLIESTYYNPDGSVMRKDIFTYQYKTEGNKVEELSYHRTEPSTSPDELGYTFYPPLGSIASKNKTEKSENGSGFGFSHKRVITYDNTGHIIEEAEYDATGALYRKKIFKVAGQTLEDGFNYDANGTPQGKYVFTYDAKGKLIKLMQKVSKGPMAPKPIDRKYLYTYDNKGNITEESAYEADGSLYSKETYTYEYDSHGNWIKQVKRSISNNGYNSTTVYYRSISYY